MVSAVSAQGNCPYAPSTRQTVCIVVTPSPENGGFCSLCFQSITHSFAGVFSTTPLQSYCSALFAQNTGGGYTPQNLPLVFKGLRTLAPNGEREGLPRLQPEVCSRRADSAGGAGYARGFTTSPYSARLVRSVVNSCSLLRFLAICCRRCPVGALLFNNGKRLLFLPRVTGHHLLSAPRVPLWSSNLLPCYPWGINHV
jgi:hypothetical protein